MRHELVAAAIQLHDQRPELVRLVDQRGEQSGEAVREEFHEIRRHPLVVVGRSSFLEIGEKLRREPVRSRDGAESGARAHGQLATIAQRRVQPDLRQIAGRIDHAGDPIAVHLAGGHLDHRQLLLHGERRPHVALHRLHGCLDQHARGATARVPNHVALFDRVGERCVGDARERERLGIEPHACSEML